MQDTILKICKQIHALLPTKRIAITRFVGKYEYGQIYVGELDRDVKREPCNYAFYKRNFCVVYSQDPTKDQETARQDFELVCTTLQDNCPFLYDPRWYKTFFDVFETTLILEFQVWERYERKLGVPETSMGDMEALYPIIYTGKSIVFVKFTNTTHPELDVNIPEQTFCYDGDMFVLPTVTGVYRDGENHRWQPLAWDIGTFGETIGPLHEDVVANLLFERIFGYDTSLGGNINESSSTEVVLRVVDSQAVHTPKYLPNRELSNAPMVLGGTVKI